MRGARTLKRARLRKLTKNRACREGRCPVVWPQSPSESAFDGRQTVDVANFSSGPEKMVPQEGTVFTL